MIGLDTNVLVRFLVEDDLDQSAKVTAFIQEAISQGVNLFISDVVLCETVWVLRSRYRFPRTEIAVVLKRLLDAEHLSFRSLKQHARALDAFSNGKGDFADYIIREHSFEAGCAEIVTFDKALWGDVGYRSP